MNDESSWRFSRLAALLGATSIFIWTPSALADDVGGVRLFLGLGGEIEGDDLEVTVNGVTQSSALYDDDEDLEDTLGIGGFYLFGVTEGFGIGPQLIYLASEGDDSNNDYGTVDGGALFRYTFQTPTVLPYIEAGVGVSYLNVDAGSGFSDVDADGFGWHLGLGGGVYAAVSDSVALGGGVLWQRQAFSGVSGDDNVGGADVEYEIDLTLSRFLLTAGVEFR